jgi:multiple sugar transport system permease protein
MSQAMAKTGLFGKTALTYLLLTILSLFCIFPFVILIINSTRFHSEIQKGFSLTIGSAFVSNWTKLLNDKNIPVVRALFNSVFISTCASLLTVYFSSVTAYGIYMYKFKFRDAASSFIMIVMMVPAQVSTLGFIRLIQQMGLMDSFVPLIIPAIAAPVVYFFLLQYMRAILPFDIVEAARIDGSNEFYTFNRIVVPILSPAIAVQAIFAFVGNWNNFFLPLLILNSKERRTIPIIIAQLRSADYMKFDMGQVYIMICIAIVPLLIIYLFLSRFIISGVTLGSVKG